MLPPLVPDLALPHHTQDCGAVHLPALDRLSADADLGIGPFLV
jgi:hypothetical protein